MLLHKNLICRIIRFLIYNCLIFQIYKSYLKPSLFIGIIRWQIKVQYFLCLVAFRKPIFFALNASFLCLCYRFCVQFFFQFLRPFECDDFSWCQHNIFSSGWISASSFLLVFHTEFTKTGDHYVIAGFQGGFDERFSHGIYQNRRSLRHCRIPGWI